MNLREARSAERQPGGQGVGREAESEGHEEKFRAVIEGATPWMNRSAKAGARSSLHYGGEAFLTHPAYQGVCGRHGTEAKDVTQGGLGGCPGEGPGRARTISDKRNVWVGPSSRRRVAKYQKRACALTASPREGRNSIRMYQKRVYVCLLEAAHEAWLGPPP